MFGSMYDIDMLLRRIASALERHNELAAEGIVIAKANHELQRESLRLQRELTEGTARLERELLNDE